MSGRNRNKKLSATVSCGHGHGIRQEISTIRYTSLHKTCSYIACLEWLFTCRNFIKSDIKISIVVPVIKVSKNKT